MNHPTVSLLPLASSLFTVACGSAVGGTSGDGIQDLKLNGLHVNGLTSNGLHVNGLTSNGLPLDGLHVNGSQMSAYMASTSQVLSGTALVGATFEVTSEQAGSEVPYVLRIDAVELDASAATPDVYLYSMSYRRQSDEVWQAVCTDDSGNPEAAIPIQGFRWDPATGQRSEAAGVVMLACRSGAIGSCASWGYRPWIPSLVEHHQACIYMKRADYCGDGTAHTVNGTWIDVYDHLSPPIQTQATGWPLEAHWGSQGASCVSSRRHPELPFSGQCLRNGVLVTLPACDEGAGAGDLLSNRAHPPA